MIAIVAACSRNLVIGRDGQLPWRLPSDLRRFRELTVGGTVVMGRRTFESLPPAYRPLPERRNLVLTSDPGWAGPGAETHASLRSALEAAGGDCFVVGGERVFRDALPLAARVYLTHVDADCEGDAFFPALDPGAWRCAWESEPAAENGVPFVFRVYERAA